jgi:hypothetical protein
VVAGGDEVWHLRHEGGGGQEGEVPMESEKWATTAGSSLKRGSLQWRRLQIPSLPVANSGFGVNANTRSRGVRSAAHV